jgi:hypothetical protein
MPPVNRNLNQRARQALYTLKREYGATIDIYKLVSSDTDVRTGQKTIVKTVVHVPRAIVMPEKTDRTSKHSISLISSNKEFVTGGTTDIGTRDFIIDRRDTPTIPDLTDDDWVVYNGRKFQIATVQAFEVDAGWIIGTRELVGEVPEQIINVQVVTYLNIESTASAVVE